MKNLWDRKTNKKRGSRFPFVFILLFSLGGVHPQAALSGDDPIIVQSELPFSTDKENQLLDYLHSHLIKRMHDAKELQIYVNPNKKTEGQRCQLVADNLIKNQIDSISKIPYTESSTQFGGKDEDNAGFGEFFEMANGKYTAGCMGNALFDFYNNYSEDKDKFSAILKSGITHESYRLMRLGGILIMMRVVDGSVAKSDLYGPALLNVIAMHLRDAPGFDLYINGVKQERPPRYCAEDFVELSPSFGRTDLFAFSDNGRPIGAIYKPIAQTHVLTVQEEQNLQQSYYGKNAKRVPGRDAILPDWVSVDKDKSLLALYFLDSPKTHPNDLEDINNSFLNILKTADCILEFQLDNTTGIQP